MRADRLISVLMMLQTHGLVTAAQVAEELEISTRTARRDLEALAMSGVPIYSQAGRGGGWRLIGGAKTDLTGLSSDESQALFLALSQRRESNPALEAALRKLMVALPERFRDDAAAVTSAIRVDPTGWGHIGPAPRQPFVDELSAAVIAGRQVEILYSTPGNDPGRRIVHPLGMVTKRNVWYLIANTDRGIRTFRLSRVGDVVQLEGTVDRPADFDLDATWDAIVTTVEQRRIGVSVLASVEPSVQRPVEYVFANRHEIVASEADGRIRMRINEVSPYALAAQLVSFGNRIELIDPPAELREEMTRLAAELAEQWL